MRCERIPASYAPRFIAFRTTAQIPAATAALSTLPDEITTTFCVRVCSGHAGSFPPKPDVYFDPLLSSIPAGKMTLPSYSALRIHCRTISRTGFIFCTQCIVPAANKTAKMLSLCPPRTLCNARRLSVCLFVAVEIWLAGRSVARSPVCVCVFV